MTAKCQLCQALIESNFAAPPTEDAEGRQRMELIEYDRLSAYMWLHISEQHPDQTQEGILCQQRAAKLYAMNWADVDSELVDGDGAPLQKVGELFASSRPLCMRRLTPLFVFEDRSPMSAFTQRPSRKLLLSKSTGSDKRSKPVNDPTVGVSPPNSDVAAPGTPYTK